MSIPARTCIIRIAESANLDLFHFRFALCLRNILCFQKIEKQTKILSTRSCNFDNDVIITITMWFFFRSILIIIQAATASTKISDAYQPNQLKPFSADSSDPYVTAGFNYDNLPQTFVVGDGGTYTLGNKNYINQPLKANTPYILFVRFIETEVLFVFFISTLLCAFWLVAAHDIQYGRSRHIASDDLSLCFTMHQELSKSFNINVIISMWPGLCLSLNVNPQVRPEILLL